MLHLQEQILLDQREILSLPIIGEQLHRLGNQMPRARYPPNASLSCQGAIHLLLAQSSWSGFSFPHKSTFFKLNVQASERGRRRRRTHARHRGHSNSSPSHVLRISEANLHTRYAQISFLCIVGIIATLLNGPPLMNVMIFYLCHSSPLLFDALQRRLEAHYCKFSYAVL
jgi:hypothetical protein